MKKILLFSLIFFFIIIATSCHKNEVFNETKNSFDFLEYYPNKDNYYQIFIRSFADSDGDGIGDLNGINSNLEYLESLGITALWLSPFHPSNSYHGYNVTNYYEVNSDFGNLEDLKNLVKNAKDKSIDIMMDLVINHSSDQHPWYKEALSNPNSPFREYYYFNGNTSAYQSFVGGMVDFDPTSELFREEVKSILDFYLDIGIKKFRIDAAKHMFDKPGLSGSDLNAGLFILELNAYLKNKYGPDTMIVSEVFDYTDVRYNSYLVGSDSIFNFFGYKHIEDKIGFQLNRHYYVSTLDRFYRDRINFKPDVIFSNFISNHDLDRLKSRIFNLNSRKQMVAAMLTMMGNPFVYYGEELDMEGRRLEGVQVSGYGTAYDEFRRTAFVWGDDRQTSWFPDNYNNGTLNLEETILNPTAIYHTYKDLLNLRIDYPALMFGDFEPFEDNSYNIQGFYRNFSHNEYNQRILVIHNIGKEAETLSPIPNGKVIYGSYDIGAYGTVIILLGD